MVPPLGVVLLPMFGPKAMPGCTGNVTFTASVMVSYTVGSVDLAAVTVMGVVPGVVPAGGVTHANTSTWAPLATAMGCVTAALAQVPVLGTNFTVHPGGTLSVRLYVLGVVS